MAFIRAKGPKGREFYELVESHRSNGKVSQKVLKYLGSKDDAMEYCAKNHLASNIRGLPIDARIITKKARLDASRPFPRSIEDRLKSELELDWIYNSNAIEGNTLTKAETEIFLESGETVRGRPLKDYYEADNHRHAISFAYRRANEARRIEEADLLQIQALLTERTLERKYVGVYRDVNVHIRGQPGGIFPKAFDVPKRMAAFAGSIAKNDEDAIGSIARAHLEFVMIHPFVDGNGRTARILTNIMLIRAGYPPIVIERRDRPRYFALIREAEKTGDSSRFVTYMRQRVEEALDHYLKNLER